MTYGTLCHATGHFAFWYSERYGFERAIFTLRLFYLTLLPAGFKASLGAGSSVSELAGLHADLRNIAPVQQFV